MDKKAKKILMNTFWSSGWKQERGPFSGEDFEYAKSKGLMFDPITITHDEMINRLHELHQQKATKSEWQRRFCTVFPRKRFICEAPYRAGH